jgi:hypothetical protein
MIKKYNGPNGEYEAIKYLSYSNDYNSVVDLVRDMDKWVVFVISENAIMVNDRVVVLGQVVVKLSIHRVEVWNEGAFETNFTPVE